MVSEGQEATLRAPGTRRAPAHRERFATYAFADTGPGGSTAQGVTGRAGVDRAGMSE